MQLAIHRFLPILKELDQAHRHVEFRFVEGVALRVLIGEVPDGFEEVHGQFRGGEEFDGGLAGEVAEVGFVGGLEEGIVIGLFDWY